MIDVKDMTVNEMDAWAANAYSLMKVTEQEAEAKAFYRCGEFIRELGGRIEKLNTSVKNWNRENEKNVKRVAALEALLRRYRDETPIGHQPNMIAHKVDELLGEGK